MHAVTEIALMYWDPIGSNKHLLAAKSSSRSLVVRPSVRLYTLTVVTVVIVVTVVNKKLFLCQTLFTKNLFLQKKIIKKITIFFTNKLVLPINFFSSLKTGFTKKLFSPTKLFHWNTHLNKTNFFHKKMFNKLSLHQNLVTN